MDFFETLDKISESITTNGKAITDKATKYAEVTKLYSKISSSNGSINKFLNALGRLYYNKHKEDEENEFSAIIKQITEENKKISEYREQIKKIKQIQICPKCGEEVKLDAIYCPKCGEKLETPKSDSKDSSFGDLDETKEPDDSSTEEFEEAGAKEFEETDAEDFEEAGAEEFEEADAEEFEEADAKEFEEADAKEFEEADAKEFEETDAEDFEEAEKEDFEETLDSEEDTIIK